MVALFARRVAVYPGDGLGEQRAATTMRLNLSGPRWAMEHLRGVLGEALDEAASGRWREPVAALLDGKGTAARDRAGRKGAARADDDGELMAEHGSPLWLVDLDRVRTRLREFRGAWMRAWPDVEVAYSYKTNRLPAILLALAAEGAGHEVVCEAEYALARDAIGARGARPDRQRPGQARCAARARRGRRRAGRRRLRARAGAGRARRRRTGRPARRAARDRRRADALRHRARRWCPTPPPALVRWACEVEALSAHLVSTGFDQPLSAAPRLGAAITVQWPPAPGGHAAAAEHLARLAVGLGVGAIDLGGGFPAAPAVAAHAAAVAGALRSHGFAGRLILEPGRALVTDAVALALTVVAVKQLDEGTRCVVGDAGTNLLPGALWSWPRIEAVDAGERPTAPALVSGPLCLNVDVLHPAAQLPEVAPGDALLVRDAGAYQQAQSTRFGDLRPAVVAHDDGRWRLCQRRETLDDLLAGDHDVVLAPAGSEEERP